MKKSILILCILISIECNAPNLSGIDKLIRSKCDFEFYCMHQSFSFELYKQLVVLEIKKPYHVMSQSMLETGNFHSQNFKDNHNLYGMKHSRRGYSLCAGNYGYAVYPHWTASVFDYRDWQQMRYKGGDYLHFLDSIHYAEDPMYTQKLKVILTTWD